jgi:dephospho-CoA kinase
MIIIGITGTLGAGKGTIVDYLQDRFHFEHFSVRQYLTDILISQGIEPNRDNFTILANRLRSENNSPSFLIEKLYEEAEKSNKNCIIESIRTVGEIKVLREKGDFYLLAVDAEPKLRYDRIVLRKSETDRIDFETFIANEQREFNSEDPNKQNLSACIKEADFILENNTDLQNLQNQVDQIIAKIEIK